MSKLHYAIIFVSDMNRSIEFYRDTVRLPLKFESPEWTEFDTGPIGLALHLAEPAPSAISMEKPIAGMCQLGIQVEDLDGFHENLVAKGVPCLRPPVEEFGVRMARYPDPDGLRFTVAESKHQGLPHS